MRLRWTDTDVNAAAVATVGSLKGVRFGSCLTTFIIPLPRRPALVAQTQFRRQLHRGRRLPIHVANELSAVHPYANGPFPSALPMPPAWPRSLHVHFSQNYYGTGKLADQDRNTGILLGTAFSSTTALSLPSWRVKSQHYAKEHYRGSRCATGIVVCGDSASGRGLQLLQNVEG